MAGFYGYGDLRREGGGGGEEGEEGKGGEE